MITLLVQKCSVRKVVLLFEMITTMIMMTILASIMTQRMET